MFFTLETSHHIASLCRCSMSSFTGAWQQALRRVALDPEKYRTVYPDMQYNEHVLFIPDSSPKSTHHFLGPLLALTQRPSSLL